MTKNFWAAVFLATCCTLRADEPAIRYVPPDKDKPGVIEVTGVSAAVLAKQHDWPAVFSVRVVSAASPMLGSYRVTGTAVRFEPRFPLVAGLTYRARFDVPGGKAVTADITLPKPPAVPTGVVERVFPTADRLPENQLKFYLHFSAPMSRGEAYRRIHLLTADGTEVPRPFLELDEELWTPDGERFTLFLHPGRVKRGLVPREQEGPVLEEGKKYTLVIDAAWPDENGNPLKAPFRKTFTAGKPDEEQPDPKRWKLHAPAAGKAEALRVQFPEPLDHALLQRVLWVVGPNGERIAGVVKVDRAETVWEFTPARPWPAGDYRLMIGTELEDLAGNSVARPFEVDAFRPVQRTAKEKVAERSFSVK